MQIFRYITLFTLLLSPFVASAWSGVTNFQSVELPRGEIYPYNSDTLLVNNDIYSSLYVDRVEEWQQDKKCDTLYHTHYTLPLEWLNREVIMRIEYVDAPYSVEINGVPFAECNSGNSPMEFNLTNRTNRGLNSVALRLNPNSASRKIEGWRELNRVSKEPIGVVSLIAREKISVRDIFMSTSCYDDKISCKIGVILKCYNLNRRESVLRYRLRNSSGDLVANGLDTIKLRYRNEDTVYISTLLPETTAWQGDRAEMQQLELELRHDNRVMELYDIPVGLRETRVNEEGDFFVNGKRVILQAKRVDKAINREEIEDLKHDGFNALFLPAGYESMWGGRENILTICDEVGLYVIVTAPINSGKSGAEIVVGGNVTNSRKWLGEYIERLERSYYTATRHPSVIAYNMASDSRNGYNLYEGYLHLKSLQRGADGALPILNLDGGGEWNSDKLKFKLVK